MQKWVVCIYIYIYVPIDFTFEVYAFSLDCTIDSDTQFEAAPIDQLHTYIYSSCQLGYLNLTKTSFDVQSSISFSTFFSIFLSTFSLFYFNYFFHLKRFRWCLIVVHYQHPLCRCSRGMGSRLSNRTSVRESKYNNWAPSRSKESMDCILSCLLKYYTVMCEIVHLKQHKYISPCMHIE